MYIRSTLRSPRWRRHRLAESGSQEFGSRRTAGGGRTTEEVWSGEIAKRVSITEEEDLSIGHQIRYRLRDAGLVLLNSPFSSRVLLIEAGKDEVEERRTPR